MTSKNVLPTYRRRDIKKAAAYSAHEIVALSLGLLLLFPIIYCVCVSFMLPNQVVTLPPSIIPKTWTLQNYKSVIETVPILRYLLNSLIMALVSGTLRVIFASMAAYAFSFFRFKGRDFLFFLCLGTVMVPGDVVIITNYKTIASLGWTNTYIGLICVFCISAMNIFVIRQNFMTYSTSLRDAALVDGCGNFRFFTRILLPTSTSVMTTVFISSFISVWNTYLWPLLIAHEESMQTVQIGVSRLNNVDAESWSNVMAAAVIVMIPTVVMFLIFRKRIIRGMMTGSVKG